MVFLKQPKTELLQLIRERSYREGKFTLASGAESSFYIDLKPTALHPRGLALIGAWTLERMQEEQVNFDAVGGLTLGADPLVCGVSLAALQQGREIPALIVRKEPKKHGTELYVEGMSNVKRGDRVLVMEDVLSTGGSALKAVERLRAAELNPVAVCTVVDREMGGSDAIRKAGLKAYSLLTISDIQKK